MNTKKRSYKDWKENSFLKSSNLESIKILEHKRWIYIKFFCFSLSIFSILVFFLIKLINPAVNSEAGLQSDFMTVFGGINLNLNGRNDIGELADWAANFCLLILWTISTVFFLFFQLFSKSKIVLQQIEYKAPIILSHTENKDEYSFSSLEPTPNTKEKEIITFDVGDFTIDGTNIVDSTEDIDDSIVDTNFFESKINKSAYENDTNIILNEHINENSVYYTQDINMFLLDLEYKYSNLINKDNNNELSNKEYESLSTKERSDLDGSAFITEPRYELQKYANKLRTTATLMNIKLEKVSLRNLTKKECIVYMQQLQSLIKEANTKRRTINV